MNSLLQSHATGAGNWRFALKRFPSKRALPLAVLVFRFAIQQDCAAAINYAFGKPVTVSSTYQTYYGSNAVDGVVSDASRWLGVATNSGNWIAIDLGAPTSLQQAHIYSGYKAQAGGWITNLQLQAWSGTAWTNIPGASTASNSLTACVLNFSVPSVATRIRLFTADTSVCRLREITLWDQAVPLYTGVTGDYVPLPAGMVATPVSWSEVALTWNDTFTNETGFVVERMGGSNGVWSTVITTAANVTSVRDCGLASATTYSYRVHAGLADGSTVVLATNIVTTLVATPRPPIVVMPLGDSITQGTSQPASVPGGYRDPLSALLATAGYEISFAGSSSNNSTVALVAAGNTAHEGHGGYTTTNLINNLDANGGTSGNNGGFWLAGIAGTRPAVYPDLILLLAGANDLGSQQLSSTQGLAGLEVLLTKLATMRPASWIIVSTLIPYIGSVYPLREQHQEEFNAALPALVASHQALGHRITLCDVRTRVNLTNASSFLCSDGVHPNQSGYNELARVWFDAFHQLPIIENWRNRYFGSPAATGSAANFADWDSDGLPNLVEYVLGTTPTNSASLHRLHGGFVKEGGTDYLSITFPRRNYADVSCVVEVVSDLSGATQWTSRAVQVGPPVSLGADLEQVTFRDPLPMDSAPARFMRLRMIAP
jgi:lysophospholipase L1-like esterase